MRWVASISWLSWTGGRRSSGWPKPATAAHHREHECRAPPGTGERHATTLVRSFFYSVKASAPPAQSDCGRAGVRHRWPDHRSAAFDGFIRVALPVRAARKRPWQVTARSPPRSGRAGACRRRHARPVAMHAPVAMDMLVEPGPHGRSDPPAVVWPARPPKDQQTAAATMARGSASRRRSQRRRHRRRCPARAGPPTHPRRRRS
jgi:hypothetical protein